MSEILKPGTIIKPKISTETAKRLIKDIYGLNVVKISDLNAYDDRNFLVKTDSNVDNPNTKHCTDGYVFKVLNSIDSKNSAFIEAQTELSLYLRSNNILCPAPVKNINGQYYSLEDCDGEKNIIRLFEFIPGKIFYEVTPTPELVFEAGMYISQIDNLLKKFDHDGYKERKTIWMLGAVPKLSEFVYVVDGDDRNMVNDIISTFQTTVLDKYETFEKSMIHGDFNEQNILVDKKTSEDAYSVIGVLDFGDTNYSCLLFEIAISLTYMMFCSGNVESGGHFLAGYEKFRNIPEHEKEVLRISCCARLCQSLVLGLYTYELDKGNEYLLTTQKAGWKLLKELYNNTDSDIRKIWDTAAKKFSQ